MSGSLPDVPVSWMWKVRDRAFDLREKTLVMGVLNLTPDSFSDGGKFADPAAAIDHGAAMIDAGADIIDIGAESTRPGTSEAELADDEEWKRLEPVVTALQKARVRVHRRQILRTMRNGSAWNRL